MPSALTRALAQAGVRLPESQLGFITGEPPRSQPAFGDATVKCLLRQWLDIPYAFLGVMTTSTAMALRLQSLPNRGGRHSVTRVEFVAATLFVPAPIPAALQQSATTLKLIAGYRALVCAAAGLLIASAALNCSRLRRA